MSRAERHILVTGAGFENKGAEAMLHALCAFVRRRLPDVGVLVPTSDAEGREELLRHGETPVAPVPPRPTVRRLWEFARSWCVPHARPPRDLTPADYRSVVAVLDVSGFASGDDWGRALAKDRWWVFHVLKSLGCPIVFLPQAWGSFEDRTVRLFTRLMLRGTTMVYARDRRSFDYVKGLKAVPEDALRLAADVAFQFEPAPPETGTRILRDMGVPLGEGGQKPVVCITPNRHLYHRFAGEAGQETDNEYLKYLARVSSYFLDEVGASVVVVPHEVSRTGLLDDIRLARILRGMLRSADGFYTVEKTCSAAELKSVVGRVDFLVASRYHAIVAAFSQRTPVVVLGWSHKYDELMTAVGLSEHTIRPEEVRSGRLETVKAAWERREEIRTELNEHVPALEASSAAALETAVGLISAAARPA